MKNFKILFFLLSQKERKQGFFLVIMITIMALLDMIGVASILPFTAVLTNPSLVETNFLLKFLFQSSSIIGVKNTQNFIFALGVLVFFLLIFSLSFKMVTTYVQVRFVEMREFSISQRLLNAYLKQPYNWFLNKNSADLGKTVLSEVEQIITKGLKPLTELISKGMVVIALISLLVLTNPKLAIIAGLSLGIPYVVVYYFVRKFIVKIGDQRLKSNQLRFKIVNESIGAIKDVKISSLEKYYIKSFATSAKVFANAKVSSEIIGLLPRYIFEAIAFGGILLIILYLMRLTGDFNSIIPILSLYVFAGYRLMPALQVVYNSVTNIIFMGPSLNKIYTDLKELELFNPETDNEELFFNKNIYVNNISYTYPYAKKPTLFNINMNIPAKSSIGIVGTTGSGKTTTIDVILGLLYPQKGRLEVDGKVISHKNLSNWQGLIGYVPQNIYLTDDSIEANISLGKEQDDIVHEKVTQAAKIANIHDFITSELPHQYKTIVGERGIRLSGGQRQRIGIARALYHNPRILILDEATSSLDVQTEKIIMEAFYNLNKNITLIIVAHRLNTVKNCDKIYLFENGHIINEGSFNDILKNNKVLAKKN